MQIVERLECRTLSPRNPVRIRRATRVRRLAAGLGVVMLITMLLTGNLLVAGPYPAQAEFAMSGSDFGRDD